MELDRNTSSETGRKRRPLVYLAGPEVFLSNAIEIGERKKALCATYGFKGVFPVDAELDVRNLSPREAARRISTENENKIRKCDLLIANITPFRGPSADVGTAYEMGFARGFGLRVCAYTNTTTPFTERIAKSLGRLAGRDAGGRLRDSNGMVIEQWGLVDNLMLDGSINSSGGILVKESVPEEDLFTYLGGFEKCLQYANKVMFVQKKHNELK
jgi:nucleoside 2-deoxyribosyltransferase